MSKERDKILADIKTALDQLPHRTEYPEWNDALAVSRKIDLSAPLKAQFAEKLRAASGVYCESVRDLADILVTENAKFGYCDPRLSYLLEDNADIAFDTEYDMARVDDYKFGITRASAGIAESGSIVLKDSVTSARLAALAPWIHIAVIRESEIVPSPKDAIAGFADDPTIIFCTGPSKTADVEGILIEGVHGPGIQIALVID